MKYPVDVFEALGAVAMSILVAGLGLVVYTIGLALMSSHRVDYCYLDTNATKLVVLKQHRPWVPDVSAGEFAAHEAAVDAARKMECPIAALKKEVEAKLARVELLFNVRVHPKSQCLCEGLVKAVDRGAGYTTCNKAATRDADDVARCKVCRGADEKRKGTGFIDKGQGGVGIGPGGGK